MNEKSVVSLLMNPIHNHTNGQKVRLSIFAVRKSLTIKQRTLQEVYAMVAISNPNILHQMTKILLPKRKKKKTRRKTSIMVRISNLNTMVRMRNTTIPLPTGERKRIGPKITIPKVPLTPIRTVITTTTTITTNRR